MAGIGGTVYVAVNGRNIRVAATCNVKPLKKIREGAVGMGGGAGYTETPRKPSASIEVFVEAGLKVSDLDFTGAVVTIEQDDGRTFIFTDAYTIGDVELDMSTGKVPIEIEGEDCTEQ